MKQFAPVNNGMDIELTKRLLNEIREKREVELFTLADHLKINVDKLRGLIEELRKRGALSVSVEADTVVLPGPRLLATGNLPELIIYDKLCDIVETDFSSLQSMFKDMDPGDLTAGLGKLISKGIVKVTGVGKNKVIKLVKKRSDYLDGVRKLISGILTSSTGISVDNFSDYELILLKELLRRPEILHIREIKRTIVKPGDKLDEVFKELSEEVSSLTSELIVSGVWRGKRFKRYDLNEKPFISPPGKFHPLHELVNEIREIFLGMGFVEATGPLIELAFVNFDMLFQPQDHPARDMQDTFYLKNPKRGRIEYPKKIIYQVKQTHEDGWVTGSSGWGGEWSIEEAKKLLLRTHTTSVSVRKVYELGESEAEIFSVGRVFRNETVDYKHLAEFMQVDGIVISRDGSVRELMGIIREFYTRLGFKDVKFWPSYFPYTEPSLQPSIYISKWGKWLELGGAGIFRPEVTYPLGVRWPVLAWGLGIERILMIKYDLNDIRIIYDNNLRWLRHIPVYR